MLRFFYTLAIRSYGVLVFLASFRSEKAKKWINGRKGWQKKFRERDLEGCIWFPCSSVGEFEQARPVIEKTKAADSSIKILLTFFSPSGYELRKDYALADFVDYIPLDTAPNMKELVSMVKPRLVIFTKYDFWFNLMAELDQNSIPMIAICVHFPIDHWLFRFPGRFFLPELKRFDQIFTQDDTTAKLLGKRGILKTTVVGDTRFDRVLQNRVEPYDNPWLEKFSEGGETIVCGSLWPKESELILASVDQFPTVRWIVAPHEIDGRVFDQWQKVFGDRLFHWKEVDEEAELSEDIKVVFVDFIGLLSKLYRFGDLAYVGGGFTTGIHNILEPASYGIPVLFGPKHQRFVEAKMLIDTGQAQSVHDQESVLKAIKTALNSNKEEIKSQSDQTFALNKGATNKVLSWIDRNINS